LKLFNTNRCRPVLKIPFFIKTNHGFTFLEIMVALSIIAIALTTIFKMHCQTVSMSFSAMFYSTAPLLAQSKLSELEAMSISDMSSDSGNFDDPFNAYTWSVDIHEPDATEFPEGVAKNLKKIDVAVSSESHQLTYTIQTYRLIRN